MVELILDSRGWGKLSRGEKSLQNESTDIHIFILKIQHEYGVRTQFLEQAFSAQPTAMLSDLNLFPLEPVVFTNVLR